MIDSNTWHDNVIFSPVNSKNKKQKHNSHCIDTRLLITLRPITNINQSGNEVIATKSMAFTFIIICFNHLRNDRLWQGWTPTSVCPFGCLEEFTHHALCWKTCRGSVRKRVPNWGLFTSPVDESDRLCSVSLLPPSTPTTAWGAAMFELTRRKKGRAWKRAAFTDYRRQPWEAWTFSLQRI